ncbi:Nicotinamidase-related amidase [Enhydrobacter aerosaccus]|uniref:Nicotinamidase-related amidase n=1 Tax=Enhydrobacter aerosaccus TaxID=225324 RepID=A0A1T4R8I9_9HYPH|nr:cysteine hydrolase [Enhydrobacter aerosaccus]SKA12334.1 Nicotinamidase-related amidase [Enhydrobacter aerosaccus]
MTSGTMPFHLGRDAVHVAIDIQRVFAEPSPWHVPWMARTIPNVVAIASRHPDRTIFTRFIPPREAGEMPGAWRNYYRHWQALTRNVLDERLLDLVEPLRRLVPPARVCDKAVYSAFANRALGRWLGERSIGTLIISGGETDVCVLATVMAAIDRGFRVVLPTDALCSGNDASHDALLALFRQRFEHQIRTASTEEVLCSWE